MADAGEGRYEHAHGCVRARGPAGRGGDDHEGPLPVAFVTLYHADGCHLCERALEVLADAQAELGFELALVDIGGDAALEAEYRELLPVVEIDGRREFTFFVEPSALRARLAESA